MAEMAARVPHEARGWFGLARRHASISFPEVVLLHKRWRDALENESGDLQLHEQRYREALELFEQTHGEVIAAYWCSSDASAVALSERPGRGILRRRTRFRFHRASDWVTKGDAAVAALLHTCDGLAIRVSEVLRGTTQHICIQLVMSSAEHALSLADEKSAPVDRAEKERAVQNEQRALAQTERYYEEMGLRESQIVYFVGMLLGGLVVLAVAGVLWLSGLEFRDVPVAAFLAGALGALISVMARITRGKFSVDYELGRSSLRFFGALRPAMGAVFGLSVYAALAGGLIDLGLPDPETWKGFWFFAFFAFAAGFSERLAKDVLDAAERTVAAAVRRSPAEIDDEDSEEATTSPRPAAGRARRRPGG